MGTHAFYLISAYGLFVLAVALEPWLVARRHRRARMGEAPEGDSE